MQISKGAAFQVERKGCAKALGWECAQYLQGIIEQSEEEAMEQL